MRILLNLYFFVALTGNLIAQTQRTIDEPMPTRQVHLDFHTSGDIPDIGKKFDKKQWQEALKTGNVNLINIFSKGHHGWSYYPTKIGKMHPNLDFDLLGAQLKASHEIGVKAPFYFTIGWSVQDAKEHPEWTIRNQDGSINAPGYDWEASGDTERPTYLWQRLDPSFGTPYHNKIMQQVEEICKMYPDFDGFWFDIYHVAKRNYNDFAMERMKREGIDITDTIAVERSHALALKKHMKALRNLVSEYNPDATVYFNAVTRIGDVSLFKERLFDMDTHQDLEDLPTTWGGYNKLPLDAKYHLQQGVPATGMSG
ncbi:MAG: alpha-L-fucosidase, partial [Pricia sp.]